jgi:hypothetical protein
VRLAGAASQQRTKPSVVAPNHLNRQFDQVEPNRFWVGDITGVLRIIQRGRPIDGQRPGDSQAQQRQRGGRQ